MRFLNPLQWNFGPRSTATLLTWAIVPILLGSFAAWQSLTTTAASLGLTADQVNALTKGMLRGVLIYVTPALVICLAAAILFSYVVVRPLWKLREGMEFIANGDLSQGPVPVASRDEVGQITQAFNVMVAQLHAMVSDMAVTAAELAKAGQRLQERAAQTASATESSASIIATLRQTAQDQAEKAAVGAQAMDELREAAGQVATSAESQSVEVVRAADVAQQVATAVEQVANSTGVVAEAAHNTRTAAEDGGKAVHAVEQSMDRVRDRVFEASEQLTALSNSLTHVDDILQLITDIAGQTDLLALNAAIEAARVGEHGRGFAVVAGEVRRLADRSRTAAGEISTRVEGLRSGAHDVVKTMETGTQEVKEGAVLAREAGSSLDRIMAAVAETQRQVESISAAAEEIAAASNQVVMSTNSLSAIAEENAATSEEMLAGTRSVSGLITDVEQQAKASQHSTGSLATAATQMSGAAAEMVTCAAQISTASSKMRDRVTKFRL